MTVVSFTAETSSFHFDKRRIMKDVNHSTTEAQKPRPKPSRAAKGGAPAPWTFPQNTLEEAISIPKAIEDKNGGNPMAADLLVKAVGYNKPNDWRFLKLLRSANLYGLVRIPRNSSAIGVN